MMSQLMLDLPPALYMTAMLARLSTLMKVHIRSKHHWDFIVILLCKKSILIIASGFKGLPKHRKGKAELGLMSRLHMPPTESGTLS